MRSPAHGPVRPLAMPENSALYVQSLATEVTRPRRSRTSCHSRLDSSDNCRSLIVRQPTASAIRAHDARAPRRLYPGGAAANASTITRSGAEPRSLCVAPTVTARQRLRTQPSPRMQRVPPPERPAYGTLACTIFVSRRALSNSRYRSPYLKVCSSALFPSGSPRACKTSSRVMPNCSTPRHSA